MSTNATPLRLQDVQKKARYGHANWLFWTDHAGVNYAGRVNQENVKAAMLAIGTKGRFYEIAGSTGTLHRMNWPLAVIRRRNCKYTEGRL